MNAFHSFTATPLPAENRVLAALPVADYHRLQPYLELVELPVGRILSEPGEPLTHVFFPVSGIVALLTPLKDGASIGTALTGNEGLVGESVFLEGMSARGLLRPVVLTPSQAYRVRAHYVLREFERSAACRHLLLRATQAQMAQIAQNAACNSRHMLPERLCSWLLHSLDRLPGDEICMTHDVLSELLGVRREGVTEAASRLQAAGVIKYGRGQIQVRDRPALERRACECYAIVNREYARLSPTAVGRDLRQAPTYGLSVA